METLTPFSEHAKVRLRISVAGIDFDVLGRVVRSRPDSGMGIAFVTIEPRSQAVLAQMLCGSSPSNAIGSITGPANKIAKICQVLHPKEWHSWRVSQYVKSHTTKALRVAIRQVVEEWSLCRRHRLSVKKASRLLRSSSLKLNLGPGPHGRAGWVNIDLFHPGADLRLDLREDWPFPDNSVSHIYSEHVFEHFEFLDEVPHFLSESLRVLQAGGVFDVGVPDTEWPIRAYGNSDDPYWPFARTILPKWCETQLDLINFHFRQYKGWGEHKYAWDEETLTRSLKRSGFTSVVRRQFDSALDSESRRTGTLYMRALKP